MGVINGQNSNAILAKRMKKVTSGERPIVATKKPETNLAVVAKIERVLFTYRETLAYYHELLEQYEEVMTTENEGDRFEYQAIQNEFGEGLSQLKAFVFEMESKLRAFPTAVTVDTSQLNVVLAQYEHMLSKYQQGYAVLEKKIESLVEQKNTTPEMNKEVLSAATISMGQQVNYIAAKVESQMGTLAYKVENSIDTKVGAAVTNAIEKQVDAIAAAVDSRVGVAVATAIDSRVGATVSTVLENQVGVMAQSVEQKVSEQFSSMTSNVSSHLLTLETLLREMKEEKEALVAKYEPVLQEVSVTQESPRNEEEITFQDSYSFFETGEQLFGNIQANPFIDAQEKEMDTSHLEELLQRYHGTLEGYKTYLVEAKQEQSQHENVREAKVDHVELLQEYKQALAYYKDFLLQCETRINTYEESTNVGYHTPTYDTSAEQETMAQLTLDLATIKSSLHILNDQVTILAEKESRSTDRNTHRYENPVEAKEQVQDEIKQVQRRIEDLMKFVGRLDGSIIENLKADSNANLMTILSKLNELEESKAGSTKGLKPLMVFNVLLGLANVAGIAILVLSMLGILTF